MDVSGVGFSAERRREAGRTAADVAVDRGRIAAVAAVCGWIEAVRETLIGKVEALQV